MRHQTSAIERLQSLPPVFRGADLTVRFQWTSKTASQYVYLWKRRGLVGGLGGHSDVFVNLLRSTRADWERALLMAMPSAVNIGIEALRRAGWTTQIPDRPSVAVNASQPYEIIARSPSWFDLVGTHVSGHPSQGLPVLRPAWALADLLRERGWDDSGLGPDDIEWSDLTDQDREECQDAGRALGLPAAVMQTLTQD